MRAALRYLRHPGLGWGRALGICATVSLFVAPASLQAFPSPIDDAPAAFGARPGAVPQRSHLLVVVGAAGDEIYREVFHRYALELIDIAASQLALADDQVTYLGERPDEYSERVTDRSSRENVERELTRIADQATPDDKLFVVLIGHGSGEGEQSKFNLPGRDLSAVEYDALLDRLVTQKVAFINTASASGDFIAVLSAPNRVIVTATRDAYQNNQTMFPRFFVSAFSADVADLDKDERVSLFEAYTYASLEVKRFYEDENRMLTETSQIDDNGDGEGIHEPELGDPDGGLARALFLDSPAMVTAAGAEAADDPELRALYDTQRQLREQIEQLRVLKDTMDPDLYEAELEKLLIELARTDQRIRDKGGR